MNNQEKYKDDHLRQFINPEMIEKTPEGFTSKVMTRINLEVNLQSAYVRPGRKNMVPVVSAFVTILLLLIAFLIPGNESDPITLSASAFLKNLKTFFPNIDLSSIFNFKLPSIILYVLIGLVILTLFDRALNGLFNKENHNQ